MRLGSKKMIYLHKVFMSNLDLDRKQLKQLIQKWKKSSKIRQCRI